MNHNSLAVVVKPFTAAAIMRIGLHLLDACELEVPAIARPSVVIDDIRQILVVVTTSTTTAVGEQQGPFAIHPQCIITERASLQCFGRFETAPWATVLAAIIKFDALHFHQAILKLVDHLQHAYTLVAPFLVQELHLESGVHEFPQERVPSLGSLQRERRWQALLR